MSPQYLLVCTNFRFNNKTVVWQNIPKVLWILTTKEGPQNYCQTVAVCRIFHLKSAVWTLLSITSSLCNIRTPQGARNKIHQMEQQIQNLQITGCLQSLHHFFSKRGIHQEVYSECHYRELRRRLLFKQKRRQISKIMIKITLTRSMINTFWVKGIQRHLTWNLRSDRLIHLNLYLNMRLHPAKWSYHIWLQQLKISKTRILEIPKNRVPKVPKI